MQNQQETFDISSQVTQNPNHASRRSLEKKLGLFKEYRKMSDAQRAEVRKRKNAAGREIHLRNVQEQENRNIQQESERYARMLQSMIAAGKTPEEADAILSKNIEIEEKRAAKKAARKEK